MRTVRRFVQVRRRLTPAAGTETADVTDTDVAEEVSKILDEVGNQGGRTLATLYHVSSSRHQGRQFARRRLGHRSFQRPVMGRHSSEVQPHSKRHAFAETRHRGVERPHGKVVATE